MKTIQHSSEANGEDENMMDNENNVGVWSRAWRRTLVVLLLGGLGACSCLARGPERYRDDTRAVLEEKNDAIKACYDALLDAGDTEMGGIVVLTFRVKKKTGALDDIQVDAAETTVPAELSTCVVEAIADVKLAPPDRRDGMATLRWEFRARP